MKPLDLVFWPAPMRFRPFEEHLRAAVAGGFSSLAIAAPTYFEARARGLSAQDLKTMARDAGVPLRHLDTLMTWAPVQQRFEDEDIAARAALTLDQGLEICAKLGLSQILATAAYHRDAVSTRQLSDGLGALCARAALQDLWVDLEPMAFTGCQNVAAAWAIIRGCGQPNCGIMMDSWHFTKGGSELGDIAAMPGHLFRSLQIADGPRLPATARLADESVGFRQWPGEGELPLLPFIRAVEAKGSLLSAGQEVFNPKFDSMPSEEVGRMAGTTTHSILSQAQPAQAAMEVS